MKQRGIEPGLEHGGAAATGPDRGLALFACGFRPFFLLAGLDAAVTIAVLLIAIGSGAWPEAAIPLFRWHAHEMLFGFVAAAMAGFLLTAVPGWTGSRPLSGAPLVALAALWLAGRVAVGPIATVPPALAAGIDVAFLPALAAVLAAPLARSGSPRNLPFLLFLTLLFVANLLFHATQHGWLSGLPFDSLRMAVNTVLLVVVIVGGRIVPAFTRNALARRGVDVSIAAARPLDIAAISAVALVLAVDVVGPETKVAGLLAGAAALLHGVRLAGWKGWKALSEPILWILHLGYAWVVIALALKAIWLLAAPGFAVNWLHALTAGAFSTMILAVTTRAALGHTGRSLTAPGPVVAAYVLVSLGAVARVFAPAIVPVDYLTGMTIAGALWGAAFLLFVVVYTPILMRPRIDGRPG